jgi:hypothetical protein
LTSRRQVNPLRNPLRARKSCAGALFQAPAEGRGSLYQRVGAVTAAWTCGCRLHQTVASTGSHTMHHTPKPPKRLWELWGSKGMCPSANTTRVSNIWGVTPSPGAICLACFETPLADVPVSCPVHSQGSWVDVALQQARIRPGPGLWDADSHLEAALGEALSRKMPLSFVV